MVALTAMARMGGTGPQRAIDALWDLILREVEGISLANATKLGRRWLVQNYAIADDQSRELYDAFTSNREGTSRRQAGLLWFNWAPATYDDPPAPPGPPT